MNIKQEYKLQLARNGLDESNSVSAEILFFPTRAKSITFGHFNLFAEFPLIIKAAPACPGKEYQRGF